MIVGQALKKDTLPLMEKDNPARIKRDNAIVKERLKGHSYREIAKNLGIAKDTIGYTLQDPDIKDIIETAQEKMVAMIPRVIDNYENLLVSEDEGMRLKASQDVAKNVGLAPTNARNQFIVNILDQSSNVISPEVLPFLRSMLGSGDSNQDAIDIEAESVVNNTSTSTKRGKNNDSEDIQK